MLGSFRVRYRGLVLIRVRVRVRYRGLVLIGYATDVCRGTDI